jgi:hypothetical protein
MFEFTDVTRVIGAFGFEDADAGAEFGDFWRG